MTESGAIRKVIIGDCELWLGDCREILPLLGKADVCITDPPYSERTRQGARTGKGRKKLIDFGALDTDAFLDVTRRMLDHTRRWVVMTCDWLHAAKLEEEEEFPLVRVGVWIKPNGAPQFSKDRPGTGWEAVAILHPSGQKHWNGGGQHAVWTVNKVEGQHPTEKPQQLIRQWVKEFSDPGETVLDPFMGSGTTGVACVKLGRPFIGIECDEKYFNLACRRIEAAYRQAGRQIQETPVLDAASLEGLTLTTMPDGAVAGIRRCEAQGAQRHLAETAGTLAAALAR